MKLIFFNFLICFFIGGMLKAQCPTAPSSNCQPIPNSQILLSSPPSVDFTFDSFNKYYSGITYSGSTLLRLTVLPNNASCKWTLRVYIDNDAGAGTPADEWEKINAPGTHGTVPALEMLEVKVSNACRTPVFNGIYKTFTTGNGSWIDIVTVNSGMLVPPGACNGSNVNGAGSYVTDYGEYSFTIDYRIKPGMNQRSGNYQVVLRFCLVEDV